MKNTILAALLLSACAGAPDVDDEWVEMPDDLTINCGPSEVEAELAAAEDKTTILPTSSIWVNHDGIVYYPAYKNLWVRAYNMSAQEKESVYLGAAETAYLLPTLQVYPVASAADSTVDVTTTDPPHLWGGCALGAPGDCWFGSTTCVSAFRTTAFGDRRLCTDWKIDINFPSIYLYADSRGVPRETAVPLIVAHEIGHAASLAHRVGTLMNPGVLMDGVSLFPLERFDQCQRDSLDQLVLDLTQDASGKVIAGLGQVPNSCAP